MIYCFDLDGTICGLGKYEDAMPNTSLIADINKLYSEGNKIIVFTARGSSSGKDYFILTESQLKQWGVKYHHLLMGKPSADFYIDDKCINVKDWKHKND